MQQQATQFSKQFVQQYYQIMSVKENRPNIANCFNGRILNENTAIFNNIGRFLSFSNMILADEQYDVNLDQQRAKLYTEDGMSGYICHNLQITQQQDSNWKIFSDIFRTLNIHQMNDQDKAELQQVVQQKQFQQQRQ